MATFYLTSAEQVGRIGCTEGHLEEGVHSGSPAKCESVVGGGISGAANGTAGERGGNRSLAA